MKTYSDLAIKSFIAIKNPQVFQPDYVFEVPEPVSNGYVNCELEHAKRWYNQIYPPKGDV